MTLEEKVNKFKEWQDVYVVVSEDIVKYGSYVGYCASNDSYAVDFYQETDDEYVEYFDLDAVFTSLEDAHKEQAKRKINMLQHQINALKKDYDL